MIYVLGVTHHVEQYKHIGNDAAAVQSLQKYVRAFCIEKSVQLLAEEWSDDAVEYWGVDSTYSEDIAADLGIEYLPCDANIAAREKLGIKSREAIAQDLGIEFSAIQPNSEEAVEVNAAASEGDRKREQFWLKRIIEHGLANKTTILVCGYRHVDRFIEHVEDGGYRATRITIQ